MTSTRLGLLGLACCVGLGQAMSATQQKVAADEAKPVLVEFRLAETKAAKGLKEATIEGSAKKIYLHAKAALTNKDIAKAKVAKSGDNLAIQVTFTEDGARKAAKISKGHQSKPLAILIDGKVVSAPILRSEISDTALITGKISKKEADRIVDGLNAR